mgnify:CR=1 FL=1
MTIIRIARFKRIVVVTAIFGSFTMLFTSCGYVSKSTLHTKSENRAYENSSSMQMPDVTLAVGERKLAYKNRIGFPPMPGGFTRLGPAKVNGLARSDQTGSVRILRPSVCNNIVAWPTKLTRNVDP